MAPIQKEETIAFRLTSNLKKSCETAARRSGLTTSDWIRAVLARAANEGAFAPPPRKKKGTKKEGPP